MKSLENKTTEITKADEAGNKSGMTYAELGLIALNNPPQGGWTTSEMRDRLKVVGKLEDNTEAVTINLEDAEFNKLTECMKGVKWNFMHKDLVSFEDYLSELAKS